MRPLFFDLSSKAFSHQRRIEIPSNPYLSQKSHCTKQTRGSIPLNKDAYFI
ncbi:hypothetical protein SynBIOSU31_01440 [Synechococcus sp. BIOS-U3-1]|nr:hypothetical protein SynBIOSU31_01440 [Synechococcus sp. BIOS-U3-1]